MTTTARIALKTTVDVAFEASIAVGASTTLKATGLLHTDTINIEGKNAAGGYSLIMEKDGAGNNVPLQFTERRNSITLKGPLDYRLNKPITVGTAGVDEYS